MNQPLEALEPAAVDSQATLARIQEAIKNVITPAWISNPPVDVGLPQAGTLKADHWRTLFTIHIPLALLSFWKGDSPIAAPNAEQMASVLSTSMHLTCAAIAMTKNTLTPQRRDLYRDSLRQHVIGLKKNFPAFILPSHHLAFHIYDFMDSFSTVHNWWCFPFENLIGKLQRTPTNHKIGMSSTAETTKLKSNSFAGEFEHTLLHSFHKGAFFRQWLLRPDCPPFLRFSRDLLDKAYGYTARSTLPSVNSEIDASDHRPYMMSHPPQDLIRLVGHSDIQCFSRVVAGKGFYTIPTEAGIGNSYVCFKPDAHEEVEWVAGQIQHIFEQGGTLRMAKHCAWQWGIRSVCSFLERRIPS